MAISGTIGTRNKLTNNGELKKEHRDGSASEISLKRLHDYSILQLEDWHPTTSGNLNNADESHFIEGDAIRPHGPLRMRITRNALAVLIVVR